MCMISSGWTVTKGTVIAGFLNLPLEVGDTTGADSGKFCFLSSPKVVGQVTLFEGTGGAGFPPVDQLDLGQNHHQRIQKWMAG